MNYRLKRLIPIFVISSVLIFGYNNCEKSGRSFSILSEQEQFSQNVAFSYTPQKIDILWVIDNSGSMETSQKNLTDNFHRFISKFKELDYDFHMAVQASDGFINPGIKDSSGKVVERRGLRDGGKLCSKRDSLGKCTGYVNTHSGVFVMNQSTKDLENVFVTNATLGINGDGDERSLQAMQETLDFKNNDTFRRPDAYLAVIVVSDEDDFSNTAINSKGGMVSYSNIRPADYTKPGIIPVSNFHSHLEGLAGPGNFSVNAITITDGACAASLNTDGFDRIIGKRIIELAGLSQGTVLSLCDDFGDGLQLMSDKIVTEILVPVYQINREPIIDTLRVSVDGKYIIEDAQNGWSYDPVKMTVKLHGSAVPSGGQQVSITYDPVSIKQ